MKVTGIAATFLLHHNIITISPSLHFILHTIIVQTLHFLMNVHIILMLYSNCKCS